MLIDLKGKKALVTGAGMGMGAAVSKLLAQQGADVVLTDLKAEWPEGVAKEIKGVKTMVLEMDVTSNDQVKRAFDKVFSTWGDLDILVNNAGVSSAPGRESVNADREIDWDTTFNINVKGVLRCCEAVITRMKARKYGKIVNFASQAGHAARKSGGAYAVSKAAVLRYTKGLAFELAPFSINVNAVCPGAVWTPFQQRGTARRQAADPELGKLSPYEAFVASYKAIIPMGRPQSPEDVAKAVAFLVSDDACNITGQCLHVDGGTILRD
ncbi:MAG: SDR family oxidoreductase [Chloroflexota bacterium]|nr:SDR family oxidoreductase [Chloroflexota bacterium]